MPPAGMTGKTVVVADAAPETRERFADALQQAGHRAVAIERAADLLRRIGDGEPDLVILGLHLSESSGVDLVRSIRELDGGGAVPILVLSGSIASAKEVRDLTDLGVAGYVNEHSASTQIMPSLAPHLFPDRFNRRLSARVALGIPVAYRCGDAIASATALNLSKGGLGLRTMSPLEVGAVVRVQFRLPRTERDVEATARVAWSDLRAGMGLEFQEVASGDLAAIEEFVDRRTARKGGRRPADPG